jgi:hypothetical protein
MDPSCDPEVRHGGRCRPTMFTKQVSRLVDGSGTAPWLPRGAGRPISKKDLVSGPDPRFVCPSGFAPCSLARVRKKGLKVDLAGRCVNRLPILQASGINGPHSLGPSLAVAALVFSRAVRQEVIREVKFRGPASRGLPGPGQDPPSQPGTPQVQPTPQRRATRRRIGCFVVGSSRTQRDRQPPHTPAFLRQLAP